MNQRRNTSLQNTNDIDGDRCNFDARAVKGTPATWLLRANAKSSHPRRCQSDTQRRARLPRCQRPLNVADLAALAGARPRRARGVGVRAGFGGPRWRATPVPRGVITASSYRSNPKTSRSAARISGQRASGTVAIQGPR